jgi:hypothetical protein
MSLERLGAEMEKTDAKILPVVRLWREPLQMGEKYVGEFSDMVRRRQKQRLGVLRTLFDSARSGRLVQPLVRKTSSTSE